VGAVKALVGGDFDVCYLHMPASVKNNS
jgi:hypothetical protein